jgi:hypothetical protein
MVLIGIDPYPDMFLLFLPFLQAAVLCQAPLQDFDRMPRLRFLRLLILPEATGIPKLFGGCGTWDILMDLGVLN